MNPVDLDRRFVRFTNDSAGSWTALWVAETMGQARSWKDLLTHHRVVVLGEAGTGKSVEFQARARSLRDHGELAWFLRLEDLQRTAWSEQLEPPLESWTTTDREGWVFIDAVEEARLHHTSLRAALLALRHALGGALRRAHVLLSSRVSDWLPGRDKLDVERLLRPPGHEPAEGDDDRYEPEVVQLAPLDLDRVRRLAVAAGADDVAGFIEALREGGAREFAGRPLDVLGLVALWGRERRLGSLQEILEADLVAKLAEWDPAREAISLLSAKEAREGVRKLALGMTLAQEWSLQLPSEGTGFSTEGLAPGDVLDDWEPPRIRELLGRPVFDEATYGRVRFHHRSVQEYLTASALVARLLEGRGAIDDILWARERVGGGWVVPAPLRAVLPWVAAFDADTFERLLAVAPEFLVLGGDPEILRPGARERVLDAILGDQRAAMVVSQQAGRRELLRFVVPSMAERVAAELRDSEIADWKVELMLRLVRAGAVGGVAPLVVEALADGTRPRDVRALAVAALAVADGEALDDWAHGACEARERLPAAILAAWLETLPTADLAVEVIRRCPVERGSYNDTELDVRIRQLLGSGGTSNVPTQLALRILDVVDQAPIPTSSTRKGWAPRYDWLICPLAHLLARSWTEAEEPSFDLDAWQPFVTFFERAWWELHHVHEHELQRALRESPKVRRALFWDAAERLRDTSGLPKWEWQVRSSSKLLQWDHDDFDWMLKDALRRPDALERRLAFDGALRKVGGDAERRARIDEVAATSEPLAKRWARVNNRADSPREAERRANERYRKLRIRAWDLREARNREVSRENLARVIAEVRSGSNRSAPRFLYDHLSADPSRFTRADLDALVQPFGPELSRAAGDGWMARWRTFRPPLPHEVTDPTAPMIDAILGLVGIAVELDSPEAIAALSGDDVDLALRHGLHQLDRRAPWFEAVVEAHPETARATLIEAARGELRLADEESGRACVVRMIRMDPAVGQLMAPTLPSLLGEEAKPRLPILRDLLAAARERLGARELAALAPIIGERFAEATQVEDHERAAGWWSLWLKAEGVGALSTLEQSIVDSDAAWFEAALGSWRPEPPALSIDDLARLAVACLAWEARRRGPEQPGPLPEDAPALAAARHLLSSIASNPAPRAVRVLTDTAEHAASEPLRSWLEVVIRRRAEADASIEWSPAQVAAFLRRLERPPETAAQLFELVQRRLADIRDDIEGGDFSLRELFGPKPLEAHVQTWLAHELRLRAHGRYQVVREPEVDERKRPDLGVFAVGVGEVRIEVKVAERWRLAQLRCGLHEQLVGRYLRPRSLRHGIYFLTCSSPTSACRDAEAQRDLSLNQLLELLRGDARRVVAENPDIDDLVVVGVVLSTPSE